jgi:[ribosomal protein S18]-alanine N-acetyltransferase
MANSEPWTTLRRSYEQCLKALNNPTREVYVALQQNEFSGFVMLNLSGPFPGYIQSIGVTPGYRNHGIGSKLIAFSEELIFRQSPNVFLCVSSFNKDAQRFYARLGYQRVGELADYVVKGHSEILMRKTLGPITDFTPAG